MNNTYRLIGVLLTVVGLFGFVYFVLNQGGVRIAISAVLCYSGYRLFKKGSEWFDLGVFFKKTLIDISFEPKRNKYKLQLEVKQ